MVPTDIGAHLTAKFGVAPSLQAAGALNGAAINRQGLNSAVLITESGAVAGAPSAQTLDAKIQDSADGSTGWADFLPAGAGSGSITQITAANSIARKRVNLMTAKQFIRVVQTAGFTAGTAPTIGAASVVVLGGADEEPPA